MPRFLAVLRAWLGSRIAFALVAAAVACGGDENGGNGGSGGAAEDGSAAASGGDGGAGGSAGGAGEPGGGTAGVSGSGGGGGAGGGAAASDGGIEAGPIQALNKIDLLLVVDNSISMGDKTTILREALPDLVHALTDPSTGIEDLHVGVITSSLGGAPRTACTTNPDEQDDDRAHLLGTRPRASSLGLDEGFLAWDSSMDVAAFETAIGQLVALAGDRGCGFESTLEALYRFAVDPAPPAEILVEPCSPSNPSECARSSGLDTDLLAQRAAFFRPDSLVAIVILTDENDCSMRPEGQFYFTSRTDVDMPRGRAVCDTNPNDPCCTSCASVAPSGCPPDPTCDMPLLPTAEDSVNLRCFEQKRRFGFETLYPVERYVRALTERVICPANANLAVAGCPDEDGDSAPDVVENPLYPRDAGGSITRSISMVQLLGIVGVPPQNVAATVDAEGQPLPSGVRRFRTASGLESAGLWPTLIGDRTASPPIPPLEPLMRESPDPRTGTTTTTGEPLAGPEAGYLENSINGHEWIPQRREDLQYACIFELAEPRDCVPLDGTDTFCDCKPSTFEPSSYDPVCQAPDGTYDSVQRFAKVYPSLRPLEVLRGLGPNAVVASICAENLSEPTSDAYGFRPAIHSALDQWKARLATP